MSEVEEKKAKLKELLNVAHTLRNAQRGVASPRHEEAEKLKNLAQECLKLSEEMGMEHGKGLSLEMLAYGKMMDLEAESYASRDVVKTPAEKEKESKGFLELEDRLQEAQKIAVTFNDEHLYTRILELLANIYRRTDDYGKEIITIEKAVKLSRTVPKVMALLDAYHRMINFLFTNQPDNADLILKVHTNYWQNYLYLKEQPGFDRDKFIQSKRILLYKVALYLGSIAGNPLNLGEQDPENYTIASEAYDEAIYIATLLNNNELLCAAHAHKTYMLLPKLNTEEKKRMLSILVPLEETYHPESSELRDVIGMLRQQTSTTENKQ